jgi:hypothetical protein
MVSLAAVGALAGCGASERDQVRAKVEQFVRAAASKDYRTICDQVLAQSLLERLAASGIACEQAMQISLGQVQSPALAIGRITIDGSSASAITLSSARGQPAALTAVRLVKTSSGWRVSGLGSPIVPPAR